MYCFDYIYKELCFIETFYNCYCCSAHLKLGIDLLMGCMMVECQLVLVVESEPLIPY